MITRRTWLGTAAVATLIPRLARGDESLLAAMDESDLIYLTPIKSNGAESSCQAEVWFSHIGTTMYVVTAVDAGAAKPARRIFNFAIRKAGVSPEEILHVGDHPETDVDGGRQAGLRTAWVNRTDAEWPDHLPEPDVTVSTISEIRELLEKASA